MGLEAMTLNFLHQTRQAAMGRFAVHKILMRDCFTVQCAVPARSATGPGTGTIVAHVSAPVLKAWTAAASGSPAQREAHVLEQLRLVLQDLSDHDMHVHLALTDTQRRMYGRDVAQLVSESLDRTSFCKLGREANVHWEGTLVRSLQPPFLVLVVSIGF